MALNSDRDGFVVPNERLNGDGTTHSLRRIERNTASILALMKARKRSLDHSRAANPNTRRPAAGGSPAPARAPAARPTTDRTSSPASAPSSAPAAAPTSSDEARRAGPVGIDRARDSRGRFVRDPGADVAGEVRQFTRQQAQQNAERERAEEARRTREGGDGSGQPRDARGRFGSGGRGGGEGDGDGGGSEGEKQGMFHRMKEFFKDRSGGVSLDGADKVDPAIESAKEVMGMVGNAVGALKATGELGRAVIGRGFGGRSQDRSSSWFKQLLQQLKLIRRDDTQFHRAELRALGDAHGGGGGGMSMIADVIKLIFSPLGAAIVATLAGIWMGFGEKIISAWHGFIDGVKEKWDSAVKTFMDIWEPISKFFADKFGIAKTVAADVGNKANAAVKSATGIDVKAGVQRVVQAVSGDKPTTSVGELAAGLDKGYRRKVDFSDLKGGAMLTKEGTYTSEEAAQIRQLKTSGANTGALPGGMPARIRDKIIAEAKAQGVDPEMALKFVQMESGGNPNAISSTGAIGLFQFTGQTATGEGITNRFNEDQNIAGGIQLAKESAAFLGKGQAKVPATPENIYLTHMLGPRAKEVIAAAAQGKSISDLDPKTQEAISKNRGANAKTAAEFIAINTAAYRNQKLPSSTYEAIAAVPPRVLPEKGEGKPGLALTPTSGAPGAPGVSAAPAPAVQGWANVLAPLGTQEAGTRYGGQLLGGNGSQRPLVLGAVRVPGVNVFPAPAGAAPTASTPAVTPTMAGAMSPPGMVAAPPRIATVRVPAQTPPAPAPRADTPIPLGSKGPVEVTVRNNETPAPQDLKDRRLAHIATGGIGG